jgi:hypothetical protein
MEKTLEIHLAEQRERIAKAINEGSYIVSVSAPVGKQIAEAINQAADIARETE